MESVASPRLTLVVGASPNPERVAYQAVERLLAAGYPVKAFGRRQGRVGGLEIEQILPVGEAVDTITLYLNPDAQAEYEEALLLLQPRRIIFNPGTENPRFAMKAREEGIEPVIACTLVLLATHQYED